MRSLGFIASATLLVAILAACGMSEPNADSVFGIQPLGVGDTTIDLLADETVHAGVVDLVHDGSTLTVTYDTSSTDWCIVETHLHVASDPADIPQNKGGLIPGQFEYSGSHACVDTVEYDIDLSSFGPGSLYFAAHAVVADTSSEQTIEVASGVGDDVYGPLFSAPDADTVWGSASSAVEACNPNRYNSAPSADAFTWGDGNFSGPDIEGATWITNLNDAPYASLEDYITASGTNFPWFAGLDATAETDFLTNCVPGLTPIDERTVATWRRYVKSFELPGYPTPSTLSINADNGYDAFVNDMFVGQEAGAPPAFQNYETHSFTPVAGDNSLEVIALNAAGGSTTFNPNGVVYLVEANYYPTESAWADGTSPGKNWSTYFEYEVCAMPDVDTTDILDVAEITSIVVVGSAADAPESDTTAYLIRQSADTYRLQFDPIGSVSENLVSLVATIDFCRDVASIKRVQLEDGFGGTYEDIAEIQNGSSVFVDFRANTAADYLDITLEPATP